MKKGGVFLIDEISLADDSVLERLNSVLEAERTLTLSEKTDKIEQIIANPKFFILATMNPGGDFGKRELSPALRNRFTEIWVEPITAKQFLCIGYNQALEEISKGRACYVNIIKQSDNDFLRMLYENLTKNQRLSIIVDCNIEIEIEKECKAELAIAIYRFVYYYNVIFCEKYLGDKRTLSLRDILTVLYFLEKCHGLSVKKGLYHALHLVVLDAIGMMFSSIEQPIIQKEIEDQITIMLSQRGYISHQTTQFYIKANHQIITSPLDNNFKLGDFGFPIDSAKTKIKTKTKINTFHKKFSSNCQKVQQSLSKLLRAMQLQKAILLEGSPGVGKTSLVEYLAFETKNKLLRINLSEQTDLMDLLGCDVPKATHNSLEPHKKMEFVWADGLLLKALKKGHWILLDELNLANQTVLEGLNAILDHRGAVFIPELNKEFVRHPRFRIFASQNPVQQVIEFLIFSLLIILIGRR